jgi:tetratricopeptide (TPR) repeat protein
MYNFNEDETMPIPANRDNQAGEFNLDETMPISPRAVSEEGSVGETMPVRTSGDAGPSAPEFPHSVTGGYAPPPSMGSPDTEPVRKPRRWLTVLGGVLLVVLLTGLGGLLGYQAALRIRWNQQQDQVAMIATTQFQLGMAELESGRYEMARRRFEYIIQIDPGFPGAAEKLTEVMMQMAMITTPTSVVETGPAPTPTPDLRGAEAIFNQAIQVYRGQDWNAAIFTLDRLRDEDINYRALEVDGMYYLALRSRGVQKIISEGNLEGGMYDLAQAGRYGPIDSQAEQYRTWARYYMTGVAFWEVDWPKVVEFFHQLYASLPNLRDGSGMTVMERFRLASIAYGNQLAEMGEYCMARDQYNTALSLGGDANLAPTATAVQLICQPPTSTPAPITPTATLPAELPTTEPTAELPTTEPTPEGIPTP